MPDADRRTTVSLTVDGKAIEASPGELIIAAAERNGIYIPRFCYHPRMRPVGMCRMCLVEVIGPRGPMLQPACFVPVAEGQEVVTESPTVKQAQDAVLELLLVNHPLDCPVCDKGGECPLQDQTFAFGPGESRFVEEKRHWQKPIALSDLVLIDRERCIQCDRCTRFADEIAGDPLIEFVGRGARLEVNTFPDQPFASYFSGNTVQLCPVGALLATPYRFKARPWDLESTETTCTTCAVGCRMAAQSSADELVRYLGVDRDEVNQGWLCDKGRFAFEAVNSAERLSHPLIRKGDELVEASWGEALDAAASALDAARMAADSGVAMIGGSRLANEDAYAWAKLAKSVLQTDSVDAQLGDGLPAELVLGLPRATVDEACAASTVVLLCPDLKEELPVLHLRLRSAVLERGLRLVEVTPQPTGLTRYAAESIGYRAGEAATGVRELLEKKAILGDDVVVVLGRPSVAEPAATIVDAAAVLVDALPGARFLSALRRGNVHGALEMGLAPAMLPGAVSLEDGSATFADGWGAVPESRGTGTDGILAAAADGGIAALILLGADPVSDYPDRELARRGVESAGFVLAVDCFLTASSSLADVVLPAAAFGERAGTTTNIEGRASSLGKKITPPGVAYPDWMIAVELAFSLRNDLGFSSLDDISAEIERLTTLLPADSRLSWRDSAGKTEVPPPDAYSLRLVSGRKLYDDGVAVQRSPSLAGLPSAPRLRMSAYDLDRLGLTTGDEVRVRSPRLTTTVEAIREPGMPRGSAALAFNLPGLHAGDVIDVASLVTDISVETV